METTNRRVSEGPEHRKQGPEVCGTPRLSLPRRRRYFIPIGRGQGMSATAPTLADASPAAAVTAGGSKTLLAEERLLCCCC